MAAPGFDDVKNYLGDTSHDDDTIKAALAAETAAQARKCRVPSPFPADLAEALMRRVAHNLALRRLPLGIQAALSDGGAVQTRVGGEDAEVRRLEGPFRKRRVG